MFYKKILLTSGLILMASLFFAVPNQGEASIVPSYAAGTVHLPQCSFNDGPGIYVKHILCGWENDRCEINTSISNNNQRESSNCREMCWGINKIATGERGSVVGATLPMFPAGTRLCTTTTNPSQVNIPTCPFPGNVGHVWVKPTYSEWSNPSATIEVYDGTVEIGESECRVGTDCQKQPLSANLGSVDIFGIQVDAGGSVNIKTQAAKPGAVYSYIQATALPIVWAYDTCIVREDDGSGDDTPPGDTPPRRSFRFGNFIGSPNNCF